MVRRNYEALVSGDGACAGCGEKSILRAAASVTEAYMRPLYHKKADRLRAKADRLEKEGAREAAGAQAAQRSRISTVPQAPSPTSSWVSAAKTTRTPPSASPITKQARPDFRRANHQRHRRRAAAGRLQSSRPAGHRWPPGQRHERHVHGRQHRLQHGLRLDAAVQSASVSVDEFAVPGRRDDQLAARRIARSESRPPLGRARAPGRRAARPRGRRHDRGRSISRSRISTTR